VVVVDVAVGERSTEQAQVVGIALAPNMDLLEEVGRQVIEGDPLAP
jgi:hypothetical protein